MTSDAARAGPLAGRCIVITRPAHQAGSLAEKVRTAGGEVIRFPVIEIAEATDLAPFYRVVDALEAFDYAIFVSPNAVDRAMTLMAARRTLPPALRVAAIGDATVRALARHGVSNVVAPAHGFDSEALLAMPEWHGIRGARIAIFRGEGGRELLGDTLTRRGAQVEYAECYRRGMPAADPAPLFRAWARNGLHAFVITSSEGLENLLDMVGAEGHARLMATPVFVPHPRIADNARQRGIALVVTAGSGDDVMLAALCAHLAPPGR